jgi:hypothetical protein
MHSEEAGYSSGGRPATPPTSLFGGTAIRLQVKPESRKRAATADDVGGGATARTPPPGPGPGPLSTGPAVSRDAGLRTALDSPNVSRPAGLDRVQSGRAITSRYCPDPVVSAARRDHVQGPSYEDRQTALRALGAQTSHVGIGDEAECTQLIDAVARRLSCDTADAQIAQATGVRALSARGGTGGRPREERRTNSRPARGIDCLLPARTVGRRRVFGSHLACVTRGVTSTLGRVGGVRRRASSRAPDGPRAKAGDVARRMIVAGR